MSRDGRYVPLDRRFAELGHAEHVEELALRSYVGRSMGLSRETGWQDIFSAAQSCVILGEAGSGKSREMQEQAKRLRATQLAAISIDLTELLGGTQGLDSDPVLSAWRRGDAMAWFFLDAVDEAKLSNVNDFHRALKRMAAWVGADAHRARYVISSRISEWRPATDKRLVEETLLQQRLSATASVDPATTGLRVLTLLPLNDQQARDFLAASGAVDERFFANVEDADAWDFLHRPLDVSNLYALWQSQGRLGVLREVVEHSVTRLLQDPQRPSRLATDRLREGAEHLAASLSFGKRVSALVPDSVMPDASDALLLRSCLPQTWPDADVRLLAQCPLFDGEAYGKIRFHHRLYQNYLSASWLARLMRSDCPYAELRHLLFGQGASGQLVLRPSLDAVAAWLACLVADEASWQLMLREDLLRNAPWVFFAHGDPRSLPLDYRIRLLRHTAEHFKGRNRVQLDWDRPTLKRFADPGLAQEVVRVIADADVAADLRSDYLLLASCGRLMEALPSAVAVAIDADASDDLRATALMCIADIGLLVHRRQVLEAFEACDSISVRLGVQLVQMAYPQILDERELFALLGRMRVGGDASSYALYSLDRFLEEVVVDRVLPLLGQLCLFLRDGGGRPREDRSWAGDWLSHLLMRALRVPRLEAPAFAIALDALTLIEACRERHWLDELRFDRDAADLGEATRKHPALRREWYWRKVAQYRVAEGSEPYAIWMLREHEAPMSPGSCDLGWLTRDIRDAHDPADRLFALRSALSLGDRANGRRSLFPPLAILRMAVWVPGLHGELFKHSWIKLTGPWHRLRQQWMWNWRKRYWWRRKLKPLLKPYWDLRNRLQLWWQRADLAQGRWVNGNWFVIERARIQEGAGQWGSYDLTQPNARYGQAVVKAAMAGADRLWRQQRPDLPHEKPRRDQTSSRTILGLVALQHAWQTQGPSYFQALTQEDAETAARYALNELNGLPPWISELVFAHPQTVSGVVTLALQGEWRTTPADAQFSAPTLQRLLHCSDERLANLARPPLLALLMGTAPASALVLGDALRLVLTESYVARALLAMHALEHLEAVTVIGEPDWPWLICLFLTAADQALDIVERISLTLNGSQRDDMAISLCANLGADHHGGMSCAAPDFERPAFLRRFIPWVYRHVRPADDAVHEGAYSPDLRDNAETFRGGLFGRLEAQGGEEVDSVLAELAGDPQMASIRDFVLHRIDQHWARLADQYTVEPGDLERLLSRHERVPRNRADLFHLAVARLGKFREEVESAEISIRRECGAHWVEADFQDWLQRWLLASANGLYNLPSEAKVDPGKFPDLRFEAAAVDGAVSVEVKVATFAHWSYASLEERLRNQLLGQYLRAQNARHGVYLLFRTEAARRWEDHDGTRLAWPELLTRLQSVADALVLARPDVDRLLVFGIDVTPPPSAAGT